MPGGEVRRQGDAEHLHPDVAGGDRLEHRRHPDEVGAERGRHADLGGRLEVRTVEPEVHTLGQLGIDGAGEVPESGAVEIGQVDAARTERAGSDPSGASGR